MKTPEELANEAKSKYWEQDYGCLFLTLEEFIKEIRQRDAEWSSEREREREESDSTGSTGGDSPVVKSLTPPNSEDECKHEHLHCRDCEHEWLQGTFQEIHIAEERKKWEEEFKARDIYWKEYFKSVIEDKLESRNAEIEKAIDSLAEWEKTSPLYDAHKYRIEISMWLKQKLGLEK